MTALEQIFKYLKKEYESCLEASEAPENSRIISTYWKAYANGVNKAWWIVRDLLVDSKEEKERFGDKFLCDELEEEE